MAINLIVIAGQLPEGYCPNSHQENLQGYAKELQVQVPDSLGFGLFSFGKNEPGVDKRPYPWMKLESNGYPEDIYVYVNGEWVGFGLSRPASQSNFDARLTLTSGTPVTTVDATGSTLYLTPYNGNILVLNSGGAWKPVQFEEVNISAATLLANTNYDVFAYLSGSDVVLEFSSAWASAIARTDAISVTDGVYTKDGDITRRYVGTVRTTASPGVLMDSNTQRFVYNAMHSLHRRIFYTADFTSTPIVSATFIAPNSGIHKVEVLCGLQTPIDLSVSGYASGVAYGIAISTDGGSILPEEAVNVYENATAAGESIYTYQTAKMKKYSPLGYHYHTLMGFATGGTYAGLSAPGSAGGVTQKSVVIVGDILA